MKIKLLILISFVLGANSMLNANEFVKIYFTNWNYLRRSAYTETDVRNKPDIFIQINDRAEINRLKNYLNLSKMQVQENIENEMVDIVIDFIQDEMIRETYILNRFFFYRKGELIKYMTPDILLKKYTLYKK